MKAAKGTEPFKEHGKTNREINKLKAKLPRVKVDQVIDEFHETVHTEEVNRQLHGIFPAPRCSIRRASRTSSRSGPWSLSSSFSPSTSLSWVRYSNSGSSSSKPSCNFASAKRRRTSLRGRGGASRPSKPKRDNISLA
jgi:hypothetical protein